MTATKIAQAIDALASAAFVEGGVSPENTQAARDLTEQRKHELIEAIGAQCLAQIEEPAQPVADAREAFAGRYNSDPADPACAADLAIYSAGWHDARAGAAPAAVVPLPQMLEKIAQGWDGCEYDAPGETLDIGADIRATAARLLAEQPSAAAGPAADGWLQDGGLLYRLTDERRPCNRDEINVTMADGSRTDEARARRAGELLDRIRGAAPALEAPAAPGVPAGFALVPIEPTQQMLDAGRWSGAGSVSIQEEWARKEVWSRMLATVAPPPAAYADDLVALVENLVQALSAAAPDNDLASHALDYLKRNGLQGSPLQAAEAAPQAPAAPVVNPSVTWTSADDGLPEHGDLVLCDFGPDCEGGGIQFGYEVLTWDEHHTVAGVARWLKLDRMPESLADHTEIDRLMAAPAAPAVDAWLPIATAPAEKLVLVAAEFDGPGDWRIKMGDLRRDGTWHVLGASWVPTRWMPLPPVPGEAANAFTYDELLEIQRAACEFFEGEDTDVDYGLLMRAAQAGYLECSQFQVRDTSALESEIAAAQAKEGGAQ